MVSMDADRALPTPAPSMAPRSGFVVLLQAPLILAAREDFAGLPITHLPRLENPLHSDPRAIVMNPESTPAGFLSVPGALRA